MKLLFNLTRSKKFRRRNINKKKKDLLVLPFYLIIQNKVLLFVTILERFPKEFVVVVTKYK
jgi:hypothetical protein